jgi:hypothetical protein
MNNLPTNETHAVHAVEYELTSQLAEEVHRTLTRWELRRGWRHDMPFLVGALILAGLIVWPSLEGWILPGFASFLMCVLMFFVLIAVWRRWALARGASGAALLALYTNDRRVRIEFSEEGVRLEAEFFRGQGAWSELEEVVVFPGYWLLQLSNGGHIVIPGSSITPDLEAFIRARAQKVMAPVRRL